MRSAAGTPGPPMCRSIRSMGGPPSRPRYSAAPRAVGQRRQDGRQPRGQHRLAGAGRADHEQIVAPGGGDFERALGALLALDVLEVDQRAVDLADLRLWAGEHLRAAEMIGELDE